MNKFSSEKFQIPPSFPFPLMKMNGQLHDNYAFVFNLNDHEPFLYLAICFVQFLAEGGSDMAPNSMALLYSNKSVRIDFGEI